MKIYLMGYMGSGKSTLGRILAKRLGYDYLDFDQYLENKEGISIKQIFENKGEIYFRKKENFYVKELIDQELTNTIISLGGGTPCYGNNMELIKNAKGISVYIQVSITELVNRLWSARSDRPLLAYQDTPEKLEEYIGKHLFERSFYYNQAAVKIVSDNRSELELVDELESRLF